MSSDNTNSSNKEMNIELASGIAAFEGKHFAVAMQNLSPLAQAGNVEAQYRVAIMQQNGLIGSENLKEAANWMRKAAEQGHAMAQHGLGFMYMEGEGVEKDIPKAIEWLEKAANQGLAGSLTTLGMIYQEGNGIDKDEERARAYYKAAGFDM